MSPLRWDVLLVGFLLALPVLALGVRGDFTAEEVALRVPWCLAAGWAAVALLRWASAPPAPARTPARTSARTPADPAAAEPAEGGPAA
ncbi:hypothetical protein JKP75_02795 [Blastococcus sp. TML/M2B]|uniref:hypothetical protein n=1 Tax=unclassified Blastococcus TaxID=2619396 RepID=UPI00190E1A10|nr:MULTISPECIES: hypothetical protein [unclassified Blastococcus]MBN1091596.1 hypothetical protein [Blastococcus sp. TML/M2B]MBN1094852.1 hypothetical protein [Blastococcus sp. TML/C7B]